MREIAFVGDVHGSIDALDGMLAELSNRSIDRIVFLGDYINKGTDSRAVLSRLIQVSDTRAVTLLRGNHETELLKVVDEKNLTTFLKMGGAATVRSYTGGSVGRDVLTEFLAALPDEHVRAIRAMPARFQTNRVLAQHEPKRGSGFRFVVSAHRQVGTRPRVGLMSARIDTGCGGDGGRLTALLWPTRRYIQVDNRGAIV